MVATGRLSRQFEGSIDNLAQPQPSPAFNATGVEGTKQPYTTSWKSFNTDERWLPRIPATPATKLTVAPSANLP